MTIIEVRGEDVLEVVAQLIKKKKRAIGLTGEDFAEEYFLKTRETPVRILQKIPWEDPACYFGKPALCLLGPQGKNYEDLKRTCTICINRKYEALAQSRCLALMKARGGNPRCIYVSGSTEEIYSCSIADAVIDIVYSGKSARAAGLAVYLPLFRSDIVLIGGAS